MSEIAADLQIRIETIRRVVESWVEWSGKSRSWEGLSTDGDTAIMSLPVPIWPTHAALENWIIVLKEVETRETEKRLIEGLREAVDALYGCRYSEQPLAKKLDALLKEITGKSKADLVLDWFNWFHREGIEP